MAEVEECARWQHPPSFYCPISRQCMHDPVVLCDGHTYERRYIEKWLRANATSPVSGAKLAQTDVFPNHALRNAIEEYFQQVFGVHRRAIGRTVREPEKADASLGSDKGLLRTIDALLQCSLLVNADLSIECMLRRIMDEAKALVGAEVASVFLLDAERQELYSTINSTGVELRLPLSVGIAGHVASTGEPEIVQDAYSDEHFNRGVDDETGFKTNSMICVPLKVRRSVIGVVQLINKTGAGVLSAGREEAEPPREGFTAQDLQFLQIFASQAGTAIGSARTREGTPSQASGEQSPVEDTSPSSGERDSTLRTVVRGRLCNEGEGASKEASLRLPKLCTVSSLASTAASPEDFAGSQAGCCGPQFALNGVEQEGEEKGDEEPGPGPGEEGDETVERLLQQGISEWHLDTLALAEATGNRPLSTLAVRLFEHLGFVEHFSLDRKKMTNFFTEIERGYDVANPYHNRAHAASVLHLMHAFMEHGGLAGKVAACFERDRAEAEGEEEECPGRLEHMACLIAAAAHDYEHLGLSNEFLVRMGNERALCYNDKSVNENHHAAGAFFLLSRPECSFLEGLPHGQFRRLRRLVIDLVIATDMSNNGQILKSFTQALDARSSEPGAYVPASSGDAVRLLQMAVKCADLGHVALDWDAHCRWVGRLEDEFYKQGDLERALGLPVSFLMDRDKPGCSETQVGFFDFVVLPLFRALARAAGAAAPALAAVEATYEAWLELERTKDAASPP